MASLSNRQNRGTPSLRARIEDAVRLSGLRYRPCYVGFLDEGERMEAQSILRGGAFASFSSLFFGGYEEAERVLLGLSAQGDPLAPAEFPLTALCFHYRKEAALTHRDVLGSLLACGIRRDKVGDILCGREETAGQAVVFVDAELSDFLADQVDRIGGEGVAAENHYAGPLPSHRQYREIEDTVPSPRLDAVVRVMIRASREAAARLIESGQVERNHRPCLSVSETVREGDVLSIRGKGRFLVDRIGPPTKKGRLFLHGRQCL